jgi:cytochrome c5
MKKIKIIILLITSVLIVSCESNTYNEISVVATNPTYTSNVQAVIKANCTGCHAGGSQFPNLETYAQVKESAQNGSLICRINQSISCGAIMPPNGAMSKQTIDMIKLWQTQGYLN